VIKLAKQRGIEVVERAIWPNELASFDEVFLTGSAAEITPVNEIAGMSFKPGKVTAALLDDFAAHTKRKNAA
jgi:branched-chain amino acid aminotransferase